MQGRLADAATAQQALEQGRAVYRPLAASLAALFMVAADLHLLSPMYQVRQSAAHRLLLCLWLTAERKPHLLREQLKPSTCPCARSSEGLFLCKHRAAADPAGLLQVSFAGLTALLTACLGSACEQQDLQPRLAAIQARAAAGIVADVQAGMTRTDKLLFAVAAAAALQRCQGSLPEAEWDALVQAAAPVQVEQVGLVCACSSILAASVSTSAPPCA